MGITTKNGDGGMTGLVKSKNVPKADERIHLLGNIDELTSHLGLVKSLMPQQEVKDMLEHIQNTLMTVMASVADPHNLKYHLSQDEVKNLEEEMAWLEGRFFMPKGWILPGRNPVSAQVDIARTIARRAERHMSAVAVKFGADRVAKQYLNRLSDCLFILARYADTVLPGTAEQQPAGLQAAVPALAADSSNTAAGTPGQEKTAGGNGMDLSSEAIIQEVLKRVQRPEKISLSAARRLIEKVEEYAKTQGLAAVIAVCGPDGNPIAVNVMDGAFLVSFDVALKKAYTSASVKMSTAELGKLVQPGATFQGLDKMEGDKMVFFGGGVPLSAKGQLIGALGVSGGTGEEDDRIAQYGLGVLEEVLSL